MGMTKASIDKLKPVGQNTASLCWLASLEMLFSCKDKDTSEIEKKLKDGGIDVKQARTTGLKIADNKMAAVSLGLEHCAFGQSLRAEDLTSRLTISPLWACGKWPHIGNLHAVLVVGASDDQVKFYDPWYDIGPWEVSDAKTRSLDYFVHGDGKTNNGADFAQGWIQLMWFK